MKQSHINILVLLSMLIAFASCKKTENAIVQAPDQHENYFVKAKLGPFEEKDYTEWMNIATFQVYFDSIDFNKKAAFYIEGRDNQGLSEYRMVVKDKPNNLNGHWVRNFMDERLFWEYGVSYQKEGFELVSLQLFRDSSGTMRHQAVWFRYKDAEQASAHQSATRRD